MNRDYDITPVGMLKNAKVWNDIYRQNVKLDLSHQIVAIYCLLTAVELYLKAFLMLNNKNYSQHKNLREIGHNFNKLSEAITRNTSNEFSNSVKILFKRHNLFLSDISVLKYPKAGNTFIFDNGLFWLDHGFDKIFETIDYEINKMDIKEWVSSLEPEQ